MFKKPYLTAYHPSYDDWRFMTLALRYAANHCHHHVPVGAVLTTRQHVLAVDVNHLHPLQHAELRVLNALPSSIGLHHVTLYVTLEPCDMCYGAIGHMGIQRVVIGALRPTLTYRYTSFGLLGHVSRRLLHQFFQEKRL
jgi:tRNA(Arg) A34 adenosine deaminase TadA